MSVAPATQYGFIYRSLSPTFTSEEPGSDGFSAQESPALESAIFPSTQILDAIAIQTWEHFHTMPDGADQKKLSLFFYEREMIEVGILPEQPVRLDPILKDRAQDERSQWGRKASLDALKPQTDEVFQTQQSKKSLSTPRERFTCPIKGCPVPYSFFKQTLIQHCKTKHPGQMGVIYTLFPELQPKPKRTTYKCVVPGCPKKYPTARSLWQHVKLKHPK